MGETRGDGRIAPPCEEALAQCRRTLEALRVTSTYHRSLFEANPHGLFTIAPTGTITDVNGAAETMLGRHRQALIGSDFAAHFTEPERVRRACRHALRLGTVRNQRLELRHPDGPGAAACCDLTVLRDEPGRTVGLLGTLRDVTAERYGAEEQLQVNRRNQVILDAAGAGIYSLDLQGHCRFANPAMLRLLGYDPEELLGRSPHETFHRSLPDGSPFPQAQCPLHGGADTPTVSRGSDVLFRRKDGTTFPVEYVRTPIFGNGWVDGVTVTFWDITERRRAEEAREESEARFRTVYDSNAIPLAFWQADGRVTEANDALLQLIGYSRAELNDGQISWSTLTLPDLGSVEAAPTIPFEREWVRRDGRRIPVLIGITRLPGKENGVAFAIDLTERKRMEEAVRMANAYNRGLIEASLDPVFVTGPNGRVTDLNAAAVSATGRSRRRLIGTDVAEHFSDPAKARALYHRVLREGAVRDVELALRQQNGRTMPVLYNVTVYRDDTGKVVGIFAAARDITASKQTEAALLLTNQELKQALSDLRATQAELVRSEKLAAVGTLAGGVAHEINNPLMGVMGYVDFARLTSAEPRLQRILDGAKRELERIRDLVKRLVASSAPVEREWQQVDLPTLLAQALEAQQSDFSSCGITVETDLPPDLPPVKATEESLMQVFGNLLSNARDALLECPTRRLRITARLRGDKVHVAVSDSGPGIPEADQGRIFDPFFTTKPPGKGTGLGLPITLNLVEALGGSVTFQSEGAGTTFTVELPVALPNESAPTHGG